MYLRYSEMILYALPEYHIRAVHYKKKSCKPDISMIYYKRCKKTRMQIPAMVPKPRNGRSRREEKAYGSKKPNGGKKHECYFNEAVT